jgi:transcriptional regulator GlxA family with amidase domain
VLFSLEPAWRKRHRFNSRLRLSPRDLATVLARVDEMEAELKQRRPGFGFLAMASFMQLVGHLSRCYSAARDADSRHLLKIAQAITHLESRTGEEINLEELAAIAGMSTRSLVRAFREATGVPPIAYLIQLRIHRAAALLRSTTDSITDIAFRVGFSDSNYFTRQFSRQTGISPRRYRQLHAHSGSRVWTQAGG